MPPPDPAVVAARRAVRAALAGTPPGSLTLAAVSGGPDSLALLAALAWEAPRHDRRAGAVTVDHGLDPGSAARAAAVAACAESLGAPATVATVAVGTAGGPENAARDARYAALDAVAAERGAVAVLLGHTRDDQAEQVLLGLARGSGARSLAGMPRRRGIYLRPFLDLPRATTEAACAALGLTPWDDPANADPALTRARVRHATLPALERDLGPGVAAALARTADLLRADADLLDRLAAEAWPDVTPPLDVARLAALDPALRSRVLRRAAIAAGAPATALTAAHVATVDALVTAWHGQRGADLPGGLAAVRTCDTLAFRPSGPF
ncbi:MAG TPA: tRNA lysidine(34) synthetase TilS [Mycobacteriales bacterium]|jgi:tRNA(Ile)-lysidine synthase|nr:tRNA lysidine(34) synthetase TilS [Mycobacteriales bacterium]